MDIYRPQFNKRPVRFPIQFYGYTTNFIYPLSESAGYLQHVIKHLGQVFVYFCFVGTLIGEFTFMLEHISNVPLMVDCLATSCIGLQFFLRLQIFMCLEKQLRSLLARFYEEIYMESEKHDKQTQLYKKLQLHLRFIDYFTKFYFSPGILFIVTFTREALSYNLRLDSDKPYIYRMSFRWYNAQTPLAYIITSFYTSWLVWSCVSMMVTGDFLLCFMLCHTSFRFKALRKEIGNLMTTTRLQASYAAEMPKLFRQNLHIIFRKHQHLSSFIDEARAYFTYQIFLGVLFDIFVLCLVMFQLQGSSISMEWMKYITWLIIEIMQIVLIGYYGQMLTDETTGLQNSFFMCKWEQLLPYGNTQTNLWLMRDIQIAILNAQKPVVFDGLKLFKLTHKTIGMVLRSAVSYFMFLNTMNNASK